MNSLAVAQTARDLRGGRARRQRNRIALRDHLRGRNRNAPLLIGKAFLAQRERRIEAERLVGQLAREFNAAMSAMYQPTLLEFDEVAPHACRRRIDSSRQVVDAACAPLQEQ